MIWLYCRPRCPRRKREFSSGYYDDDPLVVRGKDKFSQGVRKIRSSYAGIGSPSGCHYRGFLGLQAMFRALVVLFYLKRGKYKERF